MPNTTKPATILPFREPEQSPAPLYRGPRRYLLEPGECPYCDRLRDEKAYLYPPHDASQNCRSGKHSHCTCDTCF